MTRTRLVKTSFAAGELDPALLGRLDLKALEDGALRLRNVIVQATGGVTRRPGMTHVLALPTGVVRLIPFERPTGAALLALAPFRIDVIDLDTELAGPTITAPWDGTQLEHLAWVRRGDTLLLVHPDVAPQRLVRASATSWTLAPWAFDEIENDGMLPASCQPFARFSPAEVALQAELAGTPESAPIPSGSTVILRASAHLFTATHQGVRFRLRGREVEVTSVTSSSQAVGLVRQELLNGRTTRDWDEQAFSPARGYPRTLAYHQDRLVIGGSRDLPDRVWMSATGRPFNFTLGTGLDDEGITFRLAAERPHVIRSLVTARRLQVLTDAGEWVVSGFPLTPRSVQVELHTGIGSYGRRRLPPLEVDGATLFVSGSGRELREFLFADSEQAYQAADIALLARHLMVDPVDMAFDRARRLLLIVRADGAVATVTLDRLSNVVAWSLLQTGGQVRAVAAAGDLYAVVVRGTRTSLERLDDAHSLDCAVRGNSATAKVTWSGLTSLAGWAVLALADGQVVGPLMVTAAGVVTLPTPARDVVFGLPFTHEVAPMPVGSTGTRTSPPQAGYRPIRVTFRVHRTAHLIANAGRGPVALVPSRPPEDAITADVATRTAGWHRDATAPPWSVAQDRPLPCTILSATTELKVND